MKKLVIVNQHEINPPPVTGGIEKRILVLINYLKNNNIDHDVISIDDIALVKTGEIVLGFNLNDDVTKYFDYRRVDCINTITGGFGPGESQQNPIFSSDYVKLRFLSNASLKDYEGFVNLHNCFVWPHGMDENEYNNPPIRKNKYLLWTASLGWGMWAKGLDSFLELAYNNPEYDFLVYGGRWNSEDLETKLVQYESQIDNLTVNFDLQDRDKHYVYENAIALCQFTRLKESCNVTTLEAVIRGCPVITLDGVNNAGVDENLKEYNYKLSKKFLNDDFKYYINNFDFGGYKHMAQKFTVEKEVKMLRHLIMNNKVFEKEFPCVMNNVIK